MRLAHTIMEEGMPIPVLVLYPKRGELERLRSFLKSLEGKTIKLSELIENLLPYCVDIRMVLTFSPDRWYDPHRWSYYAYPYTTALKEFDGLEVKILPADREGMEELWSHIGFGIALVESIPQMKVAPIAVAVTSAPRKHVAVADLRDHAIYVFTGNERLLRELIAMGWKPVREDGELIGAKNDSFKVSYEKLRLLAASCGAQLFRTMNARAVLYS